MKLAFFEEFHMARRKHRQHPRRTGHRTKFAAAARACARSGKKPGTKSFGSCMRSKLHK